MRGVCLGILCAGEVAAWHKLSVFRVVAVVEWMNMYL